MAFSGNYMCTSFKRDLLKGYHDFTTGNDQFKLSLHTSAATGTNFGGDTTTMDETVTDYANSAEVSNTGSGSNPYTQGGGDLTNVTPTIPAAQTTTAITDFDDITFTNATITARGAIIYNSETNGGSGTTDAVVVLDFTEDKTSTAGDFQIVFPDATAAAAIIRLA